MRHLYQRLAAGRRYLVGLAGLLLAAPAAAQAPAWDGAYVNGVVSSISLCRTRAMTTDARGNVFVTGDFLGSVSFGSTTLNSAGGTDLFVAKWERASGTWAWAQRGGGTSDDYGSGLTVSGSSVYVTGQLSNSASNAAGVSFGSGAAGGFAQVYGVAANTSGDLVLAKYTDQGTTATLSWTQVGGGTSGDYGNAVTVSGSGVYVTGVLDNDRANTNAVRFGGGGTTPGTVQVNGATTTVSNDLLLVKYTDNGTSAALNWTQVGGGTYFDYGYGVAVSGSSVYVAGVLSNTNYNYYGALFGGGGTTAGTVTVLGATTSNARDMLLLKYTDNGSSATLRWTQVAGGNSSDDALGLAVSGSSLYLTGYLTNSTTNTNAVVFGSDGTTAGTRPQYGATATSSRDLVLAKYTDNGATGSYVWSQVAGGTNYDAGERIAVSGNRVYVAGATTNDAANANAVTFGGSGATVGTAAVPGATGTASGDWVLARYTDNGSTGTYNWARVAGGTDSDITTDVAVSGQQVYVAGYVSPNAPITFGPTTIPATPTILLSTLARVTDTDLTPLATPAGRAANSLALHPNPATNLVTLTGTAPGQLVQVLDQLGRVIATVPADAAGMAQLALPAGLAPGVYVVRAGSQALRLAVE